MTKPILSRSADALGDWPSADGAASSTALTAASRIIDVRFTESPPLVSPSGDHAAECLWPLGLLVSGRSSSSGCVASRRRGPSQDPGRAFGPADALSSDDLVDDDGDHDYGSRHERAPRRVDAEEDDRAADGGDDQRADEGPDDGSRAAGQ